MKKVIFGILLAGSVGSAAVQADSLDQTGWIVGGSLGVADLSFSPKNQPGLVSSSESATLMTVFGGYNFAEWFGIEFDIFTSSEFSDNNTNLDAYILGTSFFPKFTYHVNEYVAFYVKGGLQYTAYEQNVASTWNDRITWNGIDAVFGAGFQYSFNSGLRARIDYKHANHVLERSENTAFGFDFYDEEIDLSFGALTFSAHYQF